MLRIKCPYCGTREHTEFTYGEDAKRILPDTDASLDVWNTYVFARHNVAGEHLEYWQHTLGCRAWLKVQRNTLTHTISWIGLPQDTPPQPEEECS
ncbi:MAG: sarcosine oxidase subunit delta [Gammaproteobacteria bacterium]|jgi:sarcosine oxidase subunit delta|nr:sarcosine oxidase subunit delta [Gammaproteobacteria bacterium]